MSHNIDMLRGACLANSVPIDGKPYEQLRADLGGVLVDKMLGATPATSPPTKRTFDVPVQAPKEKKRRASSAWHQFVKLEKVKVREGRPDLKGHEVLAEIARRWKLQKVVNTDASPLMLTEASCSSSDTSDSAAESLAAELMASSTAEEMKANLEAAGLEVDANPAVNASRLAAHMVDEI